MQNIGIDISLTSWIYDIAEFNAGMDIMCLTSKNEGTPVSLIEAQASNLPVVSTEVGGVADIVKQNETGFIIPRTNKSEFVTKLKLLIENDELREKNEIERMAKRIQEIQLPTTRERHGKLLSGITKKLILYKSTLFFFFITLTS